MILHLIKKAQLFSTEHAKKKKKKLMWSLKWGSLITESNLNLSLTRGIVLYDILKTNFAMFYR